MVIKLPVTLQESANLRGRLEDHLTAVFAADMICRYQIPDAQPTEWQLLTGHADDPLAVPGIKSGYHIWLSMFATDRHAVLRKFQCLYTAHQASGTGYSTLTFCALFIHELAAVLTEAMEWPD